MTLRVLCGPTCLLRPCSRTIEHVRLGAQRLFRVRGGACNRSRWLDILGVRDRILHPTLLTKKVKCRIPDLV